VLVARIVEALGWRHSWRRHRLAPAVVRMRPRRRSRTTPPGLLAGA
jgi:hypothetical protein